MSKDKLLLLHGALGSTSQFASLIPLLEDRFEIHTLDFEGHGGSPMPSGHPFSMDGFVKNVLDYFQEHSIEQTHIFGYSMGGYVACKLALAHPELVRRIATLGTKYVWTPEIAAREIGYLDPVKIAAKVPQFAQALAERHTESGWETVVRRTAAMLQALGETGGFTPANLLNLQHPVRVMVGDRDNTVSIGEAAEIYRLLPQGELEVLPATRHELDKISPERVARSLLEFFV
jgi:pimeloyl-ACP methyl ester carboxylesterase